MHEDDLREAFCVSVRAVHEDGRFIGLCTALQVKPLEDGLRCMCVLRYEFSEEGMAAGDDVIGFDRG